MNRELVVENAYKSDFLTVMTHELRTPLTSILAFADIWETSNAYADDSDSAVAVAEIKQNGQSMLRIVNNILEMARIHANQVSLDYDDVDMSDLIDAVGPSIGFFSKRRNIDLSMIVDADTPVVRIDYLKVRRIVENLVSNAVKYTRKGGSADLHISYSHENQILTIVLSDTGVGIKDEDIDIIFDRFSQVNHSNNLRYKGTGLGLSVVKELVEIMGGEISVSSEYQVGSTFVVTIPAINAEEEEEQ